MKIKVFMTDGSTKIYEGIIVRTDSKNNLQVLKNMVEMVAVIKASEWKSWEAVKE